MVIMAVVVIVLFVVVAIVVWATQHTERTLRQPVLAEAFRTDAKGGRTTTLVIVTARALDAK